MEVMDKWGLNSMCHRMFFVMLFTFPIVVASISMYRNYSFRPFQWFTDDKVHGGKTQNVSTELLASGPNFKTHDFDFHLGGAIQNTTHDNLEGKEGSKTASLTSSTNDLSSYAVNLDDKLLGGLLSSEFDEASCISRMQSHLYHKGSPHKPSPYLISKLRSYEQIHTRCGPNSRAYNESMIKIEQSKNHSVETMCKYIIWIPVNGLGNQMISLAATFLYAILTDRVLLVKFGKDKHGLFCEPFLNSTWILPEKSPFWNENHIEKYEVMLEKNKASNSNESLPSTLFINLQYFQSASEKCFHCDHSQHLLKNVPLLILKSDQYFVPSLFVTPFFNMEITKMFPEKDTVFNHLGRYLFHPANEAWELISNYYQSHLANASERIGMQIRVFNPASTLKQTVMDKILNCTLKHKLLPQIDLQNPMSSTRNVSKAVFVASLCPKYADNLRTMYLKKPTVSGEVIKVYQASHEGNQKFNDNEHNMKAWMDIYLLSLSDVLVTSSFSTFGYVAQGLRNSKTHLLYRLVMNNNHGEACEQDLSLEPCYHFPPKHYCNGKPMKSFVSSFPHLRACKDFSSGVKLHG